MNAVEQQTSYDTEPIISVKGLSVEYGSGLPAIAGVDIDFGPGVTAIIGSSGCGKSTLLRALNRMNEASAAARTTGVVRIAGQDIYDRDVDPVNVRKYVGMVFQRPVPFPKTIRGNMEYALDIAGLRGRKNQDERREHMEHALRQADIWDEVKDRLDTPALAMSGGQQQRLCIARSLATNPGVLLLDEPCSALDPGATRRIEQAIEKLAENTPIVIVTHNMEQAKRVAGATALMTTIDLLGNNTYVERPGFVLEHGPTKEVFDRPKYTITERYIRGQALLDGEVEADEQ